MVNSPVCDLRLTLQLATYTHINIWFWCELCETYIELFLKQNGFERVN